MSKKWLHALKAYGNRVITDYLFHRTLPEVKQGKNIWLDGNNNKTVSSREENNRQELQLVCNIIQKSNNWELTIEGLKRIINGNSSQSLITPGSNNVL